MSATYQQAVAPAGVSPARRPSTRVRLTRRGRLVVTALILAFTVIGGLMAAGGVSAVTGGSEPAVRTVVVQPGQTLWQVAGAVDPEGDRRATVSRIQELNALSGVSVHPGQALVVPA